MQLARVFINRDSLASKVTREFLGERTFDDLASSFLPNSSGGSGGGGGGFLGFLFNAGKKFGGFLIKGLISFATWSIGGIIQWAWQKIQELTNFDWNQSEEDIKTTISSNNRSMGTQLGTQIGKGTVWLASIIISGSFVAKFPVVASRLSIELAREGGQQMSSGLFSTLGNVAETAIESILLGIYGQARKLITGKESTNKDRKPWTIAQATNNVIEKIPGNQFIKGLVSGTFEGVIDALTDVVYTISYSLDDHFEAVREANEFFEEPIRTVEVYPDANSDEHIIITDIQSNAETSIYQYLSTHQLVNNRDIGTVVGQPYDEWYTLQPQSRKLTIEFNANEKPPFVDTSGKLTRRVQISIPNVKSGISWNDLKAITPFTWGNYMARGVFEDRRQMTVWGSSQSEAKNTLLELAKFSSKSIIQVSVSHPEIQNPTRIKRPTRVYPVYASMLVRKNVPSSGNTTLIDGQNREMARKRIEIWKDDPPTNFTGF